MLFKDAYHLLRTMPHTLLSLCICPGMNLYSYVWHPWMWYDVAVVETASGYAALAGSMIFNLKDKQAHQVGHSNIWIFEHREDVHGV